MGMCSMKKIWLAGINADTGLRGVENRSSKSRRNQWRGNHHGESHHGGEHYRGR